MSVDKTNHAIHWIVIYPVDSVIHFSNNRDLLVDSVIHLRTTGATTFNVRCYNILPVLFKT